MPLELKIWVTQRIRKLSVFFAAIFRSISTLMSSPPLSPLSKLHLGPHRHHPPTLAFPLRPRAAQNRRHLGRDHRQLHRGVRALPPRGRLQIRVPAADRRAVRIGAFHFSGLPAVLRPDQPEHLAGSPLLHLPLPRRPFGAAEVPLLLRKQGGTLEKKIRLGTRAHQDNRRESAKTDQLNCWRYDPGDSCRDAAAPPSGHSQRREDNSDQDFFES